MENIRKSVVTSLDGRDTRLFPFLPYLLQDIWRIGASPEVIINLIKKNDIPNNQRIKVIDLGCGKGAVSINLAKECSFQIHGIDAVPDFIKEAKKVARKYNVEKLCTFEAGDIRISIEKLADYDIAVLGAVGPIFGNVGSTLKKVSECIKYNGYIILDDAYIDDDSDFKSNVYLKYSDFLEQIKNSKMSIVDKVIFDQNRVEESNAGIFKKIVKRANELVIKYPEQKQLFEGYVKSQKEENEILENNVISATFLLRKE